MRKYLYFFIASAVMAGCQPQEDDKIDIGLPPAQASFSIEALPQPNRYLLRNTTPEVFEYSWSLGNGASATGESVEVYYPLKGEYTISLTVFARGGFATVQQTLLVPEDAPFDCEQDPLYKFLTDCSSRTWKLKPAAGALWVGPADGSTTWWALPEAEVTVRTCAFNDEWIFSKEGQVEYDAKGDIFAEPYLGFSYECIDEASLPVDKAAWGSGTHSFEVLSGTAEKLTMVGLGAFLGLPKVANGAEVTSPQQSVTYDIVRWGIVDGIREMELEVNFGPGIWRFIYVADQ
jgi:hypothetical protein